MHIKERILEITNILFNRLFKYKINVLSIKDTLTTLSISKKNIVRFGDGEFNLIRGKGISYQDYEQQLSDRLSQIVFHNKKKDLIVGLPDVFNSLDDYTLPTKRFWLNNLRKNHSIYSKIDISCLYGNAFISRPYMELKDKSKSADYFKAIRKLWDNKNLLVVEGKYTRSGIGNNLYDNAKSVKRIICPPKNAFSYLKEIESAILNVKEDSTILLMIGPTAKLVGDDLCYLSNQIIDLGHIDTEYEWYRKGYKKKTKLNNKHTAEFNNDDNIEPIYNQTYSSQIIKKII